MSAPLMKRPQEVLDGLFLRPEIAEQFGRVRRKLRTLFSYEFLNRWMTDAPVPFRCRLLSVGPVGDGCNVDVVTVVPIGEGCDIPGDVVMVVSVRDCDVAVVCPVIPVE